MASYSTRQITSQFISKTPGCLYQKASAAVGILAPRRCLHQEPAYQQLAASTKSVSYRPMRPRPTVPFSIREQKPFLVNEDLEKLDAMYKQLLGGDLGLSEEVKWQAVTHKSFDHGWQPYNDKLAFFGKRVVLMHTSLHHLYTRPSSLGPKNYTIPTPTEIDPQVLKPFMHPDYHYLTFINRKNVRGTLDPRQLGALAHQVGLPQVMRWKPASNEDLIRSAQSQIAITCLYAIVGAVALQRGGDVAGRLVRDRILRAMGTH